MRTDLVLFFLATFCTLFFSGVPLFFFPPFLIFLFYRRPLITVLWWTLAAGIILDLTTYSLKFGLTPFAMLLTTFFVYDRKQHFFYDNLTTFPIMTMLYSSLYTLLLALFSGIPFSLPWILSDLFLMPFYDGIFALFFYTLPLMYFGPKRRRGEEYFS